MFTEPLQDWQLYSSNTTKFTLLEKSFFPILRLLIEEILELGTKILFGDFQSKSRINVSHEVGVAEESLRVLCLVFLGQGLELIVR